MIEVTVSNQQSDVAIDEGWVAALVERLAAETATHAQEVSVAFVGEAAIRDLNRNYRGMDRTTDVLSFPLGADPNPEGRINLGDIIICGLRAGLQAEEAGHGLETEIGILLIHGFLHLRGMDHPEGEADTEEVEMEREERRLREALLGHPGRGPDSGGG